MSEPNLNHDQKASCATGTVNISVDIPQAVACMWMRGGTSKGGFFLADDLPQEPKLRDAFLLRVFGSPDSTQIDGMGGANPLTSKVGIVSRSDHPDADVNYLFLQVFVDQAIVTDAQNCGNMLAAVAPFAIERGLVAPDEAETFVSIYMENTGKIAVAKVSTPGGKVSYQGTARIDGVPGISAAVPLAFTETQGSSCGALLPTGNACDMIDGINVTMIDNGMPCVLIKAWDLGLSGHESCEALEQNQALRSKLESLRHQAGPMMNLGNVSEKSVPKMTIVSPPQVGGALATRTFIPHKCHASIGVLGAVSVATAALLPGSVAAPLCALSSSQERSVALEIEHPSGQTTILLERNIDDTITQASILRTARKLFDGTIFAS